MQRNKFNLCERLKKNSSAHLCPLREEWAAQLKLRLQITATGELDFSPSFPPLHPAAPHALRNCLTRPLLSCQWYQIKPRMVLEDRLPLLSACKTILKPLWGSIDSFHSIAPSLQSLSTLLKAYGNRQARSHSAIQHDVADLCNKHLWVCSWRTN